MRTRHVRRARDSITFTVTGAGGAIAPTTISLGAGDASLDVTVVPTAPADVNGLTIETVDGGANDALLARFTANGAPVYGVPATWSQSGNPVDGTGDLVFFADEGVARPVRVAVGGLIADGVASGDVAVRSVTGVCGSSGNAASLAVLALVLGVLMFRRRGTLRGWRPPCERPARFSS